MFRQLLLLCVLALFSISTPASAGDTNCDPPVAPSIADLTNTLDALWQAIQNIPASPASLAQGVPFASAPSSMVFPASFNDAGVAAWKQSFPNNKSQEQGGILVQDVAGNYVWKGGPAGSSGMWSPNYGDLKPDETMIASLHTHPYDTTEGGFVGAGPSGADIATMVYQSEPITVVHAGTHVFAVVASQEFNESLAGLTYAQKNQLRATIDATYDTAFNAAYQRTQSFVDAVNEAARVTSTTHQFIFYSGAVGGPLTRRN